MEKTTEQLEQENLDLDREIARIGNPVSIPIENTVIVEPVPPEGNWFSGIVIQTPGVKETMTCRAIDAYRRGVFGPQFYAQLKLNYHLNDNDPIRLEPIPGKTASYGFGVDAK